MSFVIAHAKHCELPLPETFLEGEELITFEKFKIEKRRLDWLAGRLAAKRAVLAALKPQAGPREITIIPDASGRPHALVFGEPVSCPISITHSNGIALCAAGTGGTKLLGIDLEKSEPRSAAWAEFSFQPDEIISREPIYLTALWTLKEAVLKAAGTGLKAALNDIHFNGDGMDTLAAGGFALLPQTEKGTDYCRFPDCSSIVPPPRLTGRLAEQKILADTITSLSCRTVRTNDGFALSAVWS